MSGRQSAAVAYAVNLVLKDGKTRKQAALMAGVAYTSVQRALWAAGEKLKPGNPNWVRKSDSDNQSSTNTEAL